MQQSEDQYAQPYLRISDLSKEFGVFTALQGVSLDIYDGEFVCFLGPSGCGKTTLLRAIAGLDIQTTGRIEQGGLDISALPPSERDFGIVFQSYALFPNLSVARNVAYGLENRGMKRAAIQSRVDELLSVVDLADQADKYPAQLSGGQQQRVALARALAPSPGLLLLDEPLSALDAKVRVHLRSEIKDLQHRLGVTTVMVTHDQEEALTMADRIVVMNEGRVEQIGTPEAIYGNPSSAFVADFIGTMNFIPVEPAGAGQVQLGDTRLTLPDSVGIEAGRFNLAIRPEDIAVWVPELGDDNRLEVQVSNLEFLGSFVRATLELPGNAAPVRADLSINLMRDLELRPGGRLSIVLPREHLHVYPD